MPISYAERIIKQQRSTATLYQFTAVFDSNKRVVDKSSSSYDSGTTIEYIRARTSSAEVKRLASGWSDKMDTLIWVSPTVNVEENSKYDPDVIKIGTKYYYVKRVVGNTDEYTFPPNSSHNFQLVGLKATSQGAISV